MLPMPHSTDQIFTSTSYNTSLGKKRTKKRLRGNLPVDINIYTAKMDYAHPLNKDMKLEAGFKTGYVETDNAANYYTVLKAKKL